MFFTEFDESRTYVQRCWRRMNVDGLRSESVKSVYVCVSVRLSGVESVEFRLVTVQHHRSATSARS